MASFDRIPKEEMHFQPLEDIAENMEESVSHHPNLALFNRLLNAAPSPTGLMGGAFHRTSTHIQRLNQSPSIDQCCSDDDDDDDVDACKIGKGGSLPLGLGQDTQGTMCNFREEKSARTPLLDIQFSEEQNKQGENLLTEEMREMTGVERKGNENGQMRKEGKGEGGEISRALVSLLPTSLNRPASAIPIPACNSSAFMFPQAVHFSLEHCCSQPAISPAISKPPSSEGKTSLLTVPSCNEPQRFRSVSMGSEFTGS